MKTIIIEKSKNENGGIILEGYYDDKGTIISWGDTFEEAWMDFMIVYDVRKDEKNGNSGFCVKYLFSNQEFVI